MRDQRSTGIGAHIVALILAGLALAMVPLGARAQSAPVSDQADRPVISISMMTATSIAESLPFDIFRGKLWKAAPGAKFVKLHMHFDSDVFLTHVAVELCEDQPGKLKRFFSEQSKNSTERGSGAGSAYFNFDQLTGSIGDRQSFPDAATGGTLKFVLFGDDDGTFIGLKVHSFTLNFEAYSSVCVREIRFYSDESGLDELVKAAHDKENGILGRLPSEFADPLFERTAPLEVRIPRVVTGSVTATSIQAPAAAYDPNLMFDSRFEFGWLSDRNKAPKDGDTLEFKFQESQRVEKLRIWNGYQRSPRHCVTNARVKILSVVGEGGYRATLQVADRMGYQDLNLPKAYEGKSLQLKIQEVVLGLGPKDWDTGISELRFYDGKEWFLISPKTYLASIERTHQDTFKKAALGEALDRELSAGDLSIPQLQKFQIRLRSDGSMYFTGSSPEHSHDEKHLGFWKTTISALGNYEIKDAGPDGLRLRLFGIFREAEESIPDCNGCGWDCNAPETKAGNPKGRIFQETILLRRKGSSVVLVNANKQKFIAAEEITLQLEKAR